MRKVAAIFLLTCILLSITGLSLFFTVQKIWRKHEIRASLQQVSCFHAFEIQTIILDQCKYSSAIQLEWEGTDEFRYHNEMYDIVDKHIQDNQLIIHCISDNIETALLNNFIRANEKQSKQQSNLLAKLLSIQYIHSSTMFVISCKMQQRAYSILLPPALQQQVRMILTPPPRPAS